MPKTIDYYLSPMSPWTYLGHARFAELVARSAAQVNVKPVDYGRIFPVSGGLPVKQRAPQRQAYRLTELRRWRDHLALPLNLEPKYFPYAADAASLMIIAADGQHGAQMAMRLAYGIMQACWALERNCADTGTLDQIAAEVGVDGAALPLKELAAKHPDSILILDDELANLLIVMPLTLRDPELAIASAEREALLTKRKKPGVLLSLAEAYRSAGQVEKSRSAASQGLTLLPAVNAGGAMTRTRKLLELEAEAKRTSR